MVGFCTEAERYLGIVTITFGIMQLRRDRNTQRALDEYPEGVSLREAYLQCGPKGVYRGEPGTRRVLRVSLSYDRAGGD